MNPEELEAKKYEPRLHFIYAELLQRTIYELAREVPNHLVTAFFVSEEARQEIWYNAGVFDNPLSEILTEEGATVVSDCCESACLNFRAYKRHIEALKDEFSDQAQSEILKEIEIREESN